MVTKGCSIFATKFAASSLKNIGVELRNPPASESSYAFLAFASAFSDAAKAFAAAVAAAKAFAAAVALCADSSSASRLSLACVAAVSSAALCAAAFAKLSASSLSASAFAAAASLFF